MNMRILDISKRLNVLSNVLHTPQASATTDEKTSAIFRSNLDLLVNKRLSELKEKAREFNYIIDNGGRPTDTLMDTIDALIGQLDNLTKLQIKTTGRS